MPTISSTTPTTTDPATTRTSLAWTFDDGKPGGWYGYPNPGWSGTPWVAPSSGAAASGRGGLLVGGVSNYGFGAAIEVNRATVAPGNYDVTARVRLAPGQPDTDFDLTGWTGEFGADVSDAAWTTLAGHLVVPADGTAARLVVGPGHGRCGAQLSSSDFTPASQFQLDQVTLTRSGGVTPTPTVTTPQPTGAGCPTYTVSPLPPATAKIHYEVTATNNGGGFSATLVLSNLRDTPITNWSVPIDATTAARISWVSQGKVVTSTSGQTTLVGVPGATDIPAGGQVRLSIGLTGSPIGSARLFTWITGQSTGRN